MQRMKTNCSGWTDIQINGHYSKNSQAYLRLVGNLEIILNIPTSETSQLRLCQISLRYLIWFEEYRFSFLRNDRSCKNFHDKANNKEFDVLAREERRRVQFSDGALDTIKPMD